MVVTGDASIALMSSDPLPPGSSKYHEQFVQTLPRAPLVKYLHMNDKSNTEIFTFLLLPQLLCTNLKELCSESFRYGDQFWKVHFFKDEDYFGLALELLDAGHPNELKKPEIAQKQFSKKVYVDFRMTLKSRAHYSQDVVYFRQRCLFDSTKFKHGKKRFVELTALSSKRLVFDDGSSVVEVQLCNCQVILNLPAHIHKDPLMWQDFGKLQPQGYRAISLMRLDGSVANFDKALHFETDLFSHLGSMWFFTIDIDPKQMYNKTQNSGSVEMLENRGNLSVAIEISLVKSDFKKNRLPASIHDGSIVQCDTHVIRCFMHLPGNCESGIMQFEIGSQGWPLKAHQFTIEETKSNPFACEQSLNNLHDVPRKSPGSPTKLLLSTTSSTINVSCELFPSELITYKEVPFEVSATLGHPTVLLDPFGTSWMLRTKCSGRLLRFQLKQCSINSISMKEKFDLVDSSYDSIELMGISVKILPSNTQSSQSVQMVGDEVRQLIGKRSRNQSLKEDHSETATDERLIHEVAMNVDVTRAQEKSAGLLNTINNTFLVQIRWIYHHTLQHGYVHPIDEIALRQLHQLRSELERLQLENNELERQLLAKELNLVQVDPSSHGPRCMLPLNSLEIIDTRQPGSKENARSDSMFPTEPNYTTNHLNERPGSNRISRYCSDNLPVKSKESINLGCRQSSQFDSRMSDRDSVKSEYIQRRLPERRRQFTLSKATWRTCDANTHRTNVYSYQVDGPQVSSFPQLNDERRAFGGTKITSTKPVLYTTPPKTANHDYITQIDKMQHPII